MQKRWFKVASVLGALGVALGAFGAHALKSTLEANGTVETYKTAVLYHFLHSLFIMIMSLSPFHSKKSTDHVAIIALLGIIFFSGSLYLLAVLEWTWVGPITPIGGLLLITAWVMAALKTSN